MPKLMCLCDNVISLGDIPSPHQHLMISDVEFDKYVETVNAEKLYEEMKLIVKCPNCERLHVFWDGWNKPQIIYKQEDYTTNLQK
jgi:hypothetical protein